MQEAEKALKVLPSPHSCSRNVTNILISQAWEDSLPEYLRYTEENLRIMNSVLETTANTGPWCFFYMHALHSCCEMSAPLVRYPVVPPAVFRYSALTTLLFLEPYPTRKCKNGSVVQGLSCQSGPPMPETAVCEYLSPLARERGTCTTSVSVSRACHSRGLA